MAGRKDGLRVVLDTSAFVFAALKVGSIPGQALLWAVGGRNSDHP